MLTSVELTNGLVAAGHNAQFLATGQTGLALEVVALFLLVLAWLYRSTAPRHSWWLGCAALRAIAPEPVGCR